MTPFLAAVQTNDEGYPIAVRLSKIKGLRKQEIISGQQALVLFALRCWCLALAALYES